jgi:hypothetical protein
MQQQQQQHYGTAAGEAMVAAAAAAGVVGAGCSGICRNAEHAASELLGVSRRMRGRCAWAVGSQSKQDNTVLAVKFRACARFSSTSQHCYDVAHEAAYMCSFVTAVAADSSDHVAFLCDWLCVWVLPQKALQRG